MFIIVKNVTLYAKKILSSEPCFSFIYSRISFETRTDKLSTKSVKVFFWCY